MLAIRTIIFSVLILSLMGCQAMQANESAKGSSGVKEPVQLLAALSAELKLSFTAEDEQSAQKVLENNYTNQPLQWPVSTGVLVIIPVKTFEKEKGVFCREYQAKFISNSKEVEIKSMACRQENGLWVRQ